MYKFDVILFMNPDGRILWTRRMFLQHLHILGLLERFATHVLKIRLHGPKSRLFEQKTSLLLFIPARLLTGGRAKCCAPVIYSRNTDVTQMLVGSPLSWSRFSAKDSAKDCSSVEVCSSSRLRCIPERQGSYRSTELVVIS